MACLASPQLLPGPVSRASRVDDGGGMSCFLLLGWWWLGGQSFRVGGGRRYLAGNVHYESTRKRGAILFFRTNDNKSRVSTFIRGSATSGECDKKGGRRHKISYPAKEFRCQPTLLFTCHRQTAESLTR